MALSKRDKNIIKLIAFVVEMERASDKRFIFQRQFTEFVHHLSEDEKEIINAFYQEKEKTDIISMTLDTSF